MEAARVFESGYEEARRLGDRRWMVRFLSNTGGCKVAIFRYREGMTCYIDARALAEQIRDREAVTNISFNISALYMEMRDLNAAVQAAESVLPDLEQQRPAYRIKLLTHLARLRARTDNMDAAVPLFNRAIDEADREGDTAAMAQAFNQLGYEWLRRGELERAEPALIEAYRLRKLRNDNSLLLSYRTLGLLRLAQGDLTTAATLIENAVQSARKCPHLTASWQLSYDRGSVRMAQGRLTDALSDFRAAIHSARAWRLAVLPADSVRVSLEASLDDLYSSFVDAGNRLYFRTGNPALARETFQAAEENRARSLRALLAEPQQGHGLPPEHGETLARLRGALTAVAAGDSAAAGTVRRLSHELTEIEARAGLEVDSAGPEDAGTALLAKLQTALQRDEAFLSYRLGSSQSYAWTVTREGFAVYRLPPRDWIASRVREFASAMRTGSPGMTSLGNELYGALCGLFGSEVLGKTHWIVALDGPLFELPFEALVTNAAPDPSGEPRFLIGRHSIQMAPSAHLFASGVRRTDATDQARFVGVGDPIYNTADPRCDWAPSGGRPLLELPRLVGSGREIRACAEIWRQGPAAPILLEGANVSRERIRESLELRPAVLHFATHVVSSENRNLIALSLEPSGAQLLSPAEIATWRGQAGVVVLSGCNSGQGETLPGTGLAGLTRAWLAAGASAVVASRWPTPDDSGELFRSFYSYLASPGEERRPDAALRQAQLEMLRSSGWRSHPRYWAAYFIIAKERTFYAHDLQQPPVRRSGGMRGITAGRARADAGISSYIGR